MVTVKTVSDDLKSKVGQRIDADEAYGSQCVDTPLYVSKTYFGVHLWGNAIDLLKSAKQAGWLVEYNKVGDLNSYPREGWFFVMEVPHHEFGHTGYVLSADPYKMVTLETNVDGNADSLTNGGPLRQLTRDYTGVIGWFRPPYSNEPQAKPTGGKSTVEPKKVNGDLFSGLVTGVDPNIMNADSNRVKIDRIVIHHNAGTSDENARRTWYVSTGIGTSAHYQVTPDKIWGCVGENFVAYHAGDYGMNQRSIGIEHLNSTGAPSWQIAEGTYQNSAKLIADICRRYNIPIDRQHIIGHREVSATACPGGIDIDKLIRLAKGEPVVKNTTPTQKPVAPAPRPASKDPFKVRVSVSNLDIRKEPSSKARTNGKITPGIYTIAETRYSEGHEWGKLKSGAGWITLKDTKRL